jgi:PAS domain S-box-containing protein
MQTVTNTDDTHPNLMFWEYNLQSQNITFSVSLRNRLGLSKHNEDFPFSKGIHLFPKEELPIWQLQIEYASYGQLIETTGKVIISASGQHVSFQEQLFLVKTENNIPLFLKGVLNENVEQSVKSQICVNKEKQILEHIHSCLWEAEAITFRFTYIGKEVEQILGYTPQEWLAQANFWKNHIHPDDKDFAVSFCHNETLNGRNHVFEYRFLHKLGHYLWIQDRVSVISSENGTLLQGMMTDISMHNSKNSQLSEVQKTKSERLLNLLIQEGSNTIAILDEQGYYTFTSANYSVITGYSNEDLFQLNAFDYIHPDDFDEVHQNFLALLNQERVRTAPYRFKRKDGTWIWMQSVGTNLMHDPDVQGIIVNSTEISDLIQTQLALEKSNELHLMINRLAKEAVFEYDKTSNQLIWGEGIVRILGRQIESENITTDYLSMLIHPNLIGKFKRNLTAHLRFRNKNEAWQFESKFKHANGHYVDVECTAKLLRTPSGGIDRIIGMVRDISQDVIHRETTRLSQQFYQTFNQENSLEKATKNLLHQLFEPTNYSAVELWVVNHNNQRLNKLAAVSFDHPGTQFLDSSGSFGNLYIEQGLPGHVWRNKSAQIWFDLSSIPEFLRKPQAECNKINVAVGVPLTSNDQVIGVLLGFKDKKQDVDETELIIWDNIAPLIGNEIHRKQQEEAYYQLFISAPDVLAIATHEGNFSKVNPAFHQLLGYSEDEIVGNSFSYFLHPDDILSTESEYRETMTGERQAQQFSNRYRTKNGDYKWISWNSSQPFGNDKLVFAYGRDVTDLKKLEKLLNTASELAMVGGWELNPATGIMKWSETIHQLLQIDSETPITKEFFESFISPEHKHTWLNAIAQALEYQELFEIELKIIVEDKTKWLRVKGETELVHSNESLITGSIQDITEQKLNRIELERSNERYQKVSEATHDAIWDWDIAGNTLFWSSHYESHYGYNYKGLGVPLDMWSKNIHPDDATWVLETLNQLLLPSSTENSWFCEYRFRHAQGHYVHVQDKGVVIRDDKNNPIRMVGAMRDITFEKETEIQLNELNKELNQKVFALAKSNEELEQFAYVASHDLQEPLRMVTGFLYQLKNRYGNQLDEKANLYIHYAVDGAERMKTIILDLLEFSRAGKLLEETSFSLVELNEVIKDVQIILKNEIEMTQASIQFTDLPAMKGSPSMFRQIFQNLISNSLKYKKDAINPVIQISTEHTDHGIRILVQDNGIGINPSYHHKIFEIFQRLHSREKYTGTGIGLAIVKKIVESMGGKIYVESQEGEGAVFVLEFNQN